ncbi:MAG: hypothetical protein A2787_03870 [Omnitrophica WOR_2 bacterium RIFCSPHIGHO2_01_FULL_48_9]|nr:MAG: hypothetical protein A2787_03870 [Omnitrophica WOR_2 bacterium RIFCSPHIGHO2_01_FULL_48_9]
MISCILLCAGLSSRFGSPKALAKLSDGTAIERQQKILLDSPVEKIIIVLGAYAPEIKPYLLKHKKINVVHNKDYKLGQTSSFKAGLAAAAGAKAVMLLPVDYPFIKTATFEQLAQHFTKNKPRILIPTYQSRRGHPPIFASSLHDEFMTLDNDLGVNTVIHRHQADIVDYPVEDRGILATFNTLDELTKLKAQFI